MVQGEYVLGFGIVLDMITTIIGDNLGLDEGNILGLTAILIANYIILFVMLFTINKPRNKLLNYFLYAVGGFRIIVAVYNIILILKYGGM